jgi:hypothetical protein
MSHDSPVYLFILPVSRRWMSHAPSLRACLDVDHRLINASAHTKTSRGKSAPHKLRHLTAQGQMFQFPLFHSTASFRVPGFHCRLSLSRATARLIMGPATT